MIITLIILAIVFSILSGIFKDSGNILTKNYGNPTLILGDGNWIDYIKLEWFEVGGKFETTDYWSYD